MEHSAVVIMTTVPGGEEAARLGSLLLEEHLAACVQEIPVTSRFRWKGEARREPEILLLVKTAGDRAPAAVSRIESAHPYRVPEILVLEADGGAGAYPAWLAAETRPHRSQG